MNSFKEGVYLHCTGELMHLYVNGEGDYTLESLHELHDLFSKLELFLSEIVEVSEYLSPL